MRRTFWMLAILAVGALIYWYTRPPAAVIEGPRVEGKKLDDQPRVVLEGSELTRQQLLAGLAFAPAQAFPASLPLAPLQEAATKGAFPLEALLHYHPLVFLEEGLAKYEREVTGYTATFLKQERIAGKLQPPEKLEVFHRTEPFSVVMKWIEGARLASAVLYVKGENNDMMIARPRGLSFLPVSREVNGPDAKATSRYTIAEFGIHVGAKRTVRAMRKAQERGELHVRYEGVFKVPELNNRPCHKFVRTPYRPPEDEGINEMTIYIDQEMHLQTGSVLRDEKGELIAQYFFADVRLNPEFKENQFTKSGF